MVCCVGSVAQRCGLWLGHLSLGPGIGSGAAPGGASLWVGRDVVGCPRRDHPGEPVGSRREGLWDSYKRWSALTGREVAQGMACGHCGRGGTAWLSADGDVGCWSVSGP